MLALIFMFFVSPLLMVVIHIIRPRFAYFWLLAFVINVVLWGLVFSLRLFSPLEIELSSWSLYSAVPTELILKLDPYSWAFAVSLATLSMSAVMTEVAHPEEGHWTSWAGSLTLTGFGIIAVLSGNPLTLLLAWQAIDLGELLVLLGQGFTSREVAPVVIVFSLRLTGSILVIAAIIIAASSGEPLAFTNLTGPTSLLLLLGAGLRLGSVIFYAPLTQDLPLRRGLGMLFRLVSAASSLVLITRATYYSGPTFFTTTLLWLIGLGAVICGVEWVRSPNELAGRRFWILTLASLAFASALRSQADASLAWSLALLLPGGMIFLASLKTHFHLPLAIVGLLSVSALPLTPAWSGLMLYTPPFQFFFLFFLLAQGFILIGFIRFAFRPDETERKIETWAVILYLIGIFILPAVQFSIAIWNGTLLEGPGLQNNWPIICLLIILTAALVFWRMGLHLPDWFSSRLTKISNLNWVYVIANWVFHFIQRIISFINLILEGEGGMMWSFLLLLLFLSVLLGILR